MTTKPILFSTEMVQAILEGRKTQTRRVMKPQPIKEGRLWKLGGAMWSGNSVVPTAEHSLYYASQYQKGDILYVRETWAENLLNDKFIYKADEQQEDEMIQGKWKPSIHMPKKAARIFLEVANVRAERLQDISEEDAVKEGLIKEICIYQNFEKIPMYKNFQDENAVCDDARSSFMTLWQKIYGEQSWDDNPFVWVYEFKKVDKPINF